MGCVTSCLVSNWGWALFWAVVGGVIGLILLCQAGAIGCIVGLIGGAFIGLAWEIGMCMRRCGIWP